MSDTLDARLVTAAGELLDEGGLSAVTIREVARRCGVSHGAPRRHFASLAALRSAVAAQGFADLEYQLSSADGTLLGQAKSYVEFAVRRPETFDLMFRHDILEGSGRQLRATSLPLIDDWIARFLREKPSAEPVEAMAVWTSVHGIAMLTSRATLSLVEPTAEELLQVVLS